MSSIFKTPETIPSSSKTCSSWRLGMAGWILILGLIALNIGVLFETIDWNKRTVGWVLYRIDPRYWPLWPIPLLWGVVTWMASNALYRFEAIRQKRHWVKLGIVLVAMGWMAWLGGWTFMLIRRKIYSQVYVAYIMGPISMYIADGTWSWKLLISPALAVVAIASLLYVAYKQRKKNHESTSRIEKSSEPVEQ